MKIFDIKKIRPELPFKIKHTSLSVPLVYERKMRGVHVDFDVYLETLDINLQRPFVWSIDQKREFIVSLLKGVSIPPLAIVVYRPSKIETVYKIIDGKQRLSTLFSFIDGEFSIYCGDDEFFFNELPDGIQQLLLRWEPNCQVAYSYPFDNISDDGLMKWFLMLNFAGTPQDRAHLNDLLSKAGEVNV